MTKFITDYLNDKYLHDLSRGPNTTHADSEGLERWVGDYRVRRDQGDTFDEAMTQINADINTEVGLPVDTWPPGWQPVAPVAPIDPKPPTGELTRLRNDGRYFVNDAGHYFPVFASCLYALCDGKDARPALDQLAQLGFGGVRVFAGHLEGRGQSAASACERLPRFLDECLARGLYVQVAAVTDSGLDDYDVRAHVRDIAAIVSEFPHGLLCIANEYYHPTQSDQVHNAAYSAPARGAGSRALRGAVGRGRRSHR